ncbi:aromatic amino acid ammonia-lyase [Kineococcus sp. NPDC059986]|uniref:aromatic amino acid ammonia-lyase n=1 Tax=Kineococcus sp. NPDC059986 TaxID=3155538 RepID=UPI00344FED56
MILHRGADLDADAVRSVAAGAPVDLAPELLAHLGRRREALLRSLETSGPVYGVTTGMGALAGVGLDAAARARHQENLVVGRAVGSAPWLGPTEARAVLAVRLRTFLHPEAAVSPDLCLRLSDLLRRDCLPCIPLRGNGAAGEIIPLAHVGAVVLGTGRTLDGSDPGPFGLGAKEGVALLEGVPVATALAVVQSAAVEVLLRQTEQVVAASAEVLRANPDPLRPGLARGDDVLAGVHDRLRALRPAPTAEGLQAPLSVRVAPAALAVARRRVRDLQEAADRALDGVTDSPAFLDDASFAGTAGFAGTELAAASDALTAALLHVAETSVARTHRALDPRLTSLTPQLSPEPGVQAGLVALHKRAVGVAHRLRRFAVPALGGAVETSLGQEDVQSFGLEASECLGELLHGLREVLAVELLTVHRARALRGGLSGLSADLVAALDVVAAELGDAVDPVVTDRPYGLDVDRVVDLLRDGRF